MQRGCNGRVAQSRILLVEDDALIRQLLLEVLREAPFEVLEAADGRDALQHLDAAGSIDLLLTDVHMPGGYNGIEIARLARARQPNLPVVFATGRPETVSDFGTPGPLDLVLAKPFSPRQVLAAIRSLLAIAAPPAQ